MIILLSLASGKWIWIGSEAIKLEINKTPDTDRKQQVSSLTANMNVVIKIDKKETERALHLEKLGFHPLDALHVACAESGGVDVFLTTDKKLLNLSYRLTGELKMKLYNPLQWLSEVI